MLPFVGVVEKFSESLEKLELLLKESGFQSVSLSAKKLNITNQESKDLNQKMMIIKDALGDDLYEKLVEVNMDDMNLYNVVSKYYS
jgi:argonaute-like protein implicated in RNA metabolism and viral defense